MAEGTMPNPNNVLPSMLNVRSLGSGDNLNDFRDNRSGTFYITTGVQNSPADWAWLLVLGGYGTAQIIFNPNTIYLRTYTGSPLAWTSWRRFAPEPI